MGQGRCLIYDGVGVDDDLGVMSWLQVLVRGDFSGWIFRDFFIRFLLKNRDFERARDMFTFYGGRIGGFGVLFFVFWCFLDALIIGVQELELGWSFFQLWLDYGFGFCSFNFGGFFQLFFRVLERSFFVGVVDRLRFFISFFVVSGWWFRFYCQFFWGLRILWMISRGQILIEGLEWQFCYLFFRYLGVKEFGEVEMIRFGINFVILD